TVGSGTSEWTMPSSSSGCWPRRGCCDCRWSGSATTSAPVATRRPGSVCWAAAAARPRPRRGAGLDPAPAWTRRRPGPGAGRDPAPALDPARADLEGPERDPDDDARRADPGPERVAGHEAAALDQGGPLADPDEAGRDQDEGDDRSRAM